MTSVRMSIVGATLAAALAVAAVPAGLAAAVAERATASGQSPARMATTSPAYDTYAWPVQGPVIRGFEPPATPYSSGHRGIDIGCPFGTELHAANDGVVAFAGWVGGSLFISIDHPDGVRTTYSWLSSVSVKAKQAVARGEVIGATGHGHPEITDPHLHFGARVGSTYIDPMLLLEGGSVVGLIHLAPMPDQTP
jgi:murein DD-endopeptidase MepM/ murein hydrolase activator NlpD